MTTPLTALERDLLTCVERLVTACETSTEGLMLFEARLDSRTEVQISGLTDCLKLLMSSQVASMEALHGLLSEKESFHAIDKQLKKSWRLAKNAEEKLRQT
tara:strand:- start:905 stop:1207 length:303 start_codon:yes stop_codon:yes gene_type:complete